MLSDNLATDPRTLLFDGPFRPRLTMRISIDAHRVLCLGALEDRPEAGEILAVGSAHRRGHEGGNEL